VVINTDELFTSDVKVELVETLVQYVCVELSYVDQLADWTVYNTVWYVYMCICISLSMTVLIQYV